MDGREGTVYYQVIHRRVVRQINTSYKLFPVEWSKRYSRIVITSPDEDRRQYLLLLDKKIAEDTDRLENVITTLGRKGETFTADDVVSAFNGGHCSLSFSVFMREVINGLKRLEKVRIVETYTSTLNSFIRFMDGKDVPLQDMDSDLIVAYEAWLRSGGISMNTISFYMRILRATYNRVVEKGFVTQRFPFKQKDLNNGILTYRRKKTGQQLFVRWEPCMQEIVDCYNIPGPPYLFPLIVRPGIDERKQYINASHRINWYLKAIGKELGLSVLLTHYVARHSWASAARSKNIPISVISEGMGHNSETTIRIYLASLDTTSIDKVNKLILKSLCDK